jgi:hypothetical protein
METEESSIGVQTIKLFGESVGISSIPEDAARHVAENLKFQLKVKAQELAISPTTSSEDNTGLSKVHAQRKKSEAESARC